MAPAQHLAWFNDNIDWLVALGSDDLDTAVPACPGWTVESVINHLTFGLGRGLSAPRGQPVGSVRTTCRASGNHSRSTQRPASYKAF
ncbi:MAG: maleylpyruvate isomerase N-terminal domain-containing protein [Acidimicrobiales bacterium]